MKLKKRLSMRRAAVRAWWKRTRHKMLHVREELALWQAKRMAEENFKRTGVRHFIVPTPEGQLRVLSWTETLVLRDQGYFPYRFKIRDLYTLALWWTAASRRVVHGNSLPKRSIDRERMYRWWYMTHSRTA